MKTVKERFWEKVDIKGEDECWNWKAGKLSDGYGAFRFKGSMKLAHRVAYELTNDKNIINQITHICNNKLCCNPKHLTQLNVKERFWEKVDIKGDDDCWNWKASKGTGYGQFRFKDNMKLAHRMAYELTNGEIPDFVNNIQIYVLHKCDNPACCNPNHLWLGTHIDNMRDMVNKGRSAKQNGENHGRAKLTQSDVNEIRKLYKTNKYYQWEIGLMFGIGQQNISKIINDKRWCQ